VDNRPIRVLLVDDDEDYYVLTRALLSDIESERYDLEWVATYKAALEVMGRNVHDVCLLDYHLGGRTGLDLLRAALERDYKTPMIMLTGQGDHELDLEAMRTGAADYLTKGKTDAALLERSIRYAIERARALEALRKSERHNAALYEKEQERSRELERAYADLRQAESLRDDLTHMIAHDLRNPLTTIIVNLDLSAMVRHDPDYDDDLPRLLMTARSAGERMINMIGDLLHVSKLEAGELRPALDTLSLPALLAEKDEACRSQAEGENKTLVIHASADLPPVMADAELIGRVIDNLISNALKYTVTGGRIEISAERHDQNLVVCVRDDGQGIPLEYHARIFDKFVQVTDSMDVPLRKGAGLGLAFCRLAVEAHGGKIWVESVPGQGSAFSFTLPLEQPSE